MPPAGAQPLAATAVGATGRWARLVEVGQPGLMGEVPAGGAVGLGGGYADGGVQREAVQVPGAGPALGALYGAASASPSTEAGQSPVRNTAARRSKWTRR